MTAEPPSPEEILRRARSIASPREREAYLASATGQDDALQARLAAMLRADSGAELSSGLLRDLALEGDGEKVGEREGDRIGHYKLLQQIGEGGFGTVWMAEQKEALLHL